MKKLGFSKKGEADEDGNRSALFGSRSKGKSPSSNASANPYAQPALASDPYTQAKVHAGVMSGPQGASSANGPGGPPPDRQGGYGSMGEGGYGGSNGNGGSGRHGEVTGGYGGDQKYGGLGDSKSSDGTTASGYGADRYGTQNGYGTNRYGAGPGTSQSNTSSSRYGAGGYGGLGPAGQYDSNLDDNREALFGGARERLQHRSQHPDNHDQPPPYGADHSQGAPSERFGGESGSGYEAYGDRQLTAEEEEEEDVQATKQEIRFIKQADVSSTRNALRVAAQAEETGRNTLARIGAQGEMIHNTEKHLDLTSNHNRVAEEKARQLKTLNKSMFAVHVSNPFTAASRRQKRDDEILEKHQTERILREATRREGYESDKRMQQNFKDLDATYSATNAKTNKSSLAERAKYQFEADSEDEQMENEIDSNIDALHGAAVRLNGLARATGKELDEQNRHLKRINDKVSRLLETCHQIYFWLTGFFFRALWWMIRSP